MSAARDGSAVRNGSAVRSGSDGSYAALARELQATGLISDPWLRGAPRFEERPRVLERAEWTAAVACAEAVAAAYDELVRLCAAEPALLESFFAMTPAQRAMFRASAPLWHGVARADVFFTERGPVCCELNCDTPSGQAEAVLLGARAARGRRDVFDPSARLEDATCGLLGALAPCASIGIVYPTEMTEDLSMVALYRRWFEARGARVVLGSPFNLALRGGAVHLLGEPVDLVVRHYKTDWWGEREPVWDDAEGFQDEAPLAALEPMLAAARAGACAFVNPFAAVLPQNKRAMAFFWEHLDRFSEPARRAIRAYVPRTVRLEAAADRARERWVLKSDYGCEGAEVVVGADVDDAEWNACMMHAIPRRWVLQERFDARGGENLGVYLVAGRAAGAYLRVQRGATDDRAKSAPVLVRRRRA